VPLGSLAAQCPDGTAPPCRSRAPSGGATTVAILYFDNLSPDTADAYLADGVTEELIVRIGAVPRLSVKSRYAVRRFRAQPARDPAELGHELGVTYLVTGSVRRSGDHVRVTAELMRAGSGVRVWGDVYDRSEGDLLSLQTDLARDLAGGIIGRLAPTEQARLATLPTRNAPAYEHFLRGNFALAQRSPAALVRALGEYQEALALDPDFSTARARLALGYAVFFAWGWRHPSLPAESLLSRGLAAARMALQRDSTSSDAWMAYGIVVWLLQPRTIDAALSAQRRSLAIDPGNAEAANMLGVMLFNLGRDSAAAEALHRALAIEPGRPITLTRLAEIAWLSGRYPDARRLLDSAVTVAPTFYVAYEDRAWVLLHFRDTTAARADAETALRLAPEDFESGRGVLAAVQAAEGDTLRARTGLDSLLASLDRLNQIRHVQVFNVAMPLVALGDTGRALDLIERVRPRAMMLWWSLRWPELNPLRVSPRFRRIVDEASPGAP
jgi:TolB-like protein/Flp pilus assembly protein TadD